MSSKAVSERKVADSMEELQRAIPVHDSRFAGLGRASVRSRLPVHGYFESRDKDISVAVLTGTGYLVWCDLSRGQEEPQKIMLVPGKVLDIEKGAPFMLESTCSKLDLLFISRDNTSFKFNRVSVY